MDKTQMLIAVFGFAILARVEDKEFWKNVYRIFGFLFSIGFIFS